MEDDLSDIKYYQLLNSPGREISLLFLTTNQDYTAAMAREQIELLYGNAFSWIKNYFVCTTSTIKEFLKNNPFDLYIMDALGGKVKLLIKEVDLPKEKIAFLTGMTSFRESVKKESYKAYKKDNITKLIKDCF